MIDFHSEIYKRQRAPLPRFGCEHVIAGHLCAAQILREGVLLSLCAECWEKQHLLRVTADGKLIVIETGDAR